MEYMRGSDDQRLDALFRVYAEACSTPEVSANFMPNLWSQIEARQRNVFSFSRMAGALVTAALAFSLALGFFLSSNPNPAYFNQNYVEALTQDNSNTPDFIEPVRYEVQ